MVLGLGLVLQREVQGAVGFVRVVDQLLEGGFAEGTILCHTFAPLL